MAEECIPDRIADIENRITALEDLNTGPAGPAGLAATITIGSVTTVDPGMPASVANSGTQTAAILDMSIPQGETGPSVGQDVLQQVGEIRDEAAAASAIAVAAAQQANGVVVGSERTKIVDLATTTPFVGQISGFPIVDGVQTSLNTKVADHNNTDKTFRGIWLAQAGAWIRSTDADTAAKVSGMGIFVRGGLKNKGAIFLCRSSILTLGTDELDFSLKTSGGNSLQSICAQSRGVWVDLGDSNDVGRVARHRARVRGLFNKRNGPLKDWQYYAMADSGMRISAIRDSIATGDRNAAPVSYIPNSQPGFGAPVANGGGEGNLWMAINALKQSTNCIFSPCLGINDFGLGAPSRLPGGPGHPDTFRDNCEQVFATALIESDCHILLRIPQPFEGIDYIEGSNVTQWGTDAPASEPTVAGGAAARSAEMIGVLREFANISDRITVLDYPKLVYGADRCDDSNVDCLDLQTGPTFMGTAIPNSARSLIDDPLHLSELGALREHDVLTKCIGLENAVVSKPEDYFIIGSSGVIEWHKVREWFVLRWEGLTLNGAHTLMKVRQSPENLHYGATLSARLFSASDSATQGLSKTLREAERRILNGGINPVTRVLDWRNAIKIFFPLTGQLYTATEVSLSGNPVSDAPTPLPASFIQMQFNNVNMVGEVVAHRGIDMGYPGTVSFDTSKNLAFVYIDDTDSLPEYRQVTMSAQGLGAASNLVGSLLPSGVVKLRSMAAARQNTSSTGFPTFTGTINDGAAGAGNILTVAGIASGTPYGLNGPIRVGTYVTYGSTPVRVAALGTGTGGNGTYTVEGAAVNVASQAFTVNPSVAISVSNQNDGRYVDGSINNGLASGYEVGRIDFSRNIKLPTGNQLVFNTVNIDAAIAANIGWQGTAGSNIVTQKPGMYFQSNLNFTLPAGIVIETLLTN